MYKHIIILGDGMADHPVERLAGKTLLQYANTPNLDEIARRGRSGTLATIPAGFAPGSEVANTAILGYDLNEVYEGRGALEAASIGYEMQPDDMAMRCNIITLADGKIQNHHGGHLKTEEAAPMIEYLNEHLADDRVRLYTGIQYRHLLVIKGGNKHIVCTPPHDHPGEQWRPRLVAPEPGWEDVRDGNRMTAAETAELINSLILKSQELLAAHPVNQERMRQGRATANSLWPWSPGYRPSMQTIHELYPQVGSGAVISAVDLIRGIGHYAGLEIIKVPGATGLYDTNYEGKAQAAIDALRKHDFVFLHVEASDEAGHDGDLDLKLRTIENLDSRIVGPILHEVETWTDTPVAIAVLPDHPTPVEMRIHVDEPVPFSIWHPGIQPDQVEKYSESDCARGAYGALRLSQFMHQFMNS